MGLSAWYCLTILFALSRFDHKLELFGVDLNTLKAKVPERIFRAWLEDWEKEAIKHNDVVSERKLLEKTRD
jgi:tRNA A-37 threonylcarbamoyl transferase component Bud32